MCSNIEEYMCLMDGLAESSETESYCSNTDRTLEGVSSNSSEWKCENNTKIL